MIVDGKPMNKWMLSCSFEKSSQLLPGMIKEDVGQL
jgi:hypothetical protein